MQYAPAWNDIDSVSFCFLTFKEGKTSPLRKAISPLRRKEDLYGITQLGKSGDKTHENAIERGAFEIKPIKSSQSSL
nr:hypothetical protein Q903MT_gene166 [Picea sitchensis]